MTLLSITTTISTLSCDFFLFLALNCSAILAPLNGHMICTGRQVTNQNCTFTCDPGYYITGSISRTCLPNQTWSGLHPQCHRLRCPVLVAPMNSVVTYPCDDRYKSTCHLLCKHGYEVEGIPRTIEWEQTCTLNDSNTVDWNSSNRCIGKKIIKRLTISLFHSL